MDSEVPHQAMRSPPLAALATVREHWAQRSEATPPLMQKLPDPPQRWEAMGSPLELLQTRSQRLAAALLWPPPHRQPTPARVTALASAPLPRSDWAPRPGSSPPPALRVLPRRMGQEMMAPQIVHWAARRLLTPASQSPRWQQLERPAVPQHWSFRLYPTRHVLSAPTWHRLPPAPTGKPARLPLEVAPNQGARNPVATQLVERSR
eukprot:SRR837773.6053.p3 GENE.SRR837773.6053~~SRR837773.6053.p3  ORF type:complete len:241 (-),score=2.07 SRR837773.6053:318-935(-)